MARRLPFRFGGSVVRTAGATGADFRRAAAALRGEEPEPLPEPEPEPLPRIVARKPPPRRAGPPAPPREIDRIAGNGPGKHDDADFVTSSPVPRTHSPVAQVVERVRKPLLGPSDQENDNGEE